MRVFRVHWWTDEGKCGGYSWYRSEPEARQAMREAEPAPGREDSFEAIEIEPTVDGVLDALTKYASHPEQD